MGEQHGTRTCLRPPIPEIAAVAMLLNKGVQAHLAGNRAEAAAAFFKADDDIVRDWTESLWGSAKGRPERAAYAGYRKVAEALPRLLKADRVAVRMPSKQERLSLIKHWGHRCAFCGIPVVRGEVRRAIVKEYPETVRWGDSNAEQHAGFQCLWLQYDHLLPHSRGGGNSLDNVAITCAPCNYGRGDDTLAERGLIDPRSRPVPVIEWDGLERFLNVVLNPSQM